MEIGLEQHQLNCLVHQRILKTSIKKKDNEMLYWCDIIDNTQMKEGMVIYVIQQGKESDWFFSTDKGKLEVSEELGFKRTILLSIDYHRVVSSFKSIHDEVEKIGELFRYQSFNDEVTIMTDETGVGKRSLLFEKESTINGIVWVEETWNDSDDGTYSRKLLFSGERSLVQSEATVICKEIDISQSIRNVNYFNGVVCGLRKIYLKENKDIVVCGGGVHIMARGIKHWCNNCRVISVELDGVVAEAGEKCFKTKEEIECYVGDGIEFVRNRSFDCIIIDVDCKVQNENDVAAPHPLFIEDETIEMMKKSIKDDQGLIIYNIVARDDLKKKGIIGRIAQHFESIYQWECEEDVNVLLFCFKIKESGYEDIEDIDSECTEFDKDLKRIK